MFSNPNSFNQFLDPPCNPDALKLCHGCGKYIKPSEFSNSQRKKGHGRCKDCTLNFIKVQNTNFWLMKVVTKQDEFSKNFWTSLPAFPINIKQRYSNCVALNEDEFVVVSLKKYEYDNNNISHLRVHKYNTINNKWILFVDNQLTANNSITWSYQNEKPYITIDKKKAILYIYGYNIAYKCSVIMIDLNNKLNMNIIKDVPKTYTDHGDFSVFIYAKDQLHLLSIDYSYEYCTGANEYYHSVLLLNKDKLIFNKIYTFNKDNTITSINPRGFVYLSNKNEILVFSNFSQNECDIWRYSITNNIWSKSVMIGPKRMYSFGYVLTSDCKHIIMFSPHRGYRNDFTKEIIVWNLDTMKMKKSKILCPFCISMQAVILSNHSKSLFIVNAFIRDFNNNKKYLHNEIIKLITKWYIVETVYLINTGRFEREKLIHWKIDVHQILNNT